MTPLRRVADLSAMTKAQRQHPLLQPQIDGNLIRPGMANGVAERLPQHAPERCAGVG